MANSTTSIANLALQAVPFASILDFNEDSKAAKEIRTAWPQAMGELMEACSWTFGTVRETLALVTNSRTPAWAYAYELPVNVAVLQKITQSPTATVGAYQPTFGQTIASVPVQMGSFYDREQTWPYELDESYLYTDVAGAVAQYTRTDPPVSSLPPLFVSALAFRLAASVVIPLTNDPTRVNGLFSLYEMARSRAMAADLNRQPQVVDLLPEVLQVR